MDNRPQKLATIVREMLLTRRERVELYGKDDNDEWIVCKKASPGNLQSFEELLAGACMSPSLARNYNAHSYAHAHMYTYMHPPCLHYL